MNVLVAHPSLNAGGGSERLCLTIIESLKEKGFNVTLGTFEKTRWNDVENLFKDISKPHAEIVKPRIFGRSAYGELMNFHRLLSSLSKKYEITIVSCTSPWFYCPATKKAILYMIPPVHYLKGVKRAYLAPYIFIQHMLIKRAKNKVFLTNSSFSSKIIEDVYSIKCKVLYPPVNTERFFASSKKEDWVVSLGRFDQFKRFEVLIKAFAKVELGRCILIGSAYNSASNKYLMNLKRLISSLKLNPKVDLIVNSPFSAIQKILSKAKIYVHCAQFEHFGISVVEAMASGCVPVVHKSGGPYLDIIERGRVGFAFESVKELANNINVLLQNHNLFRDFSQKAMQRSKFFGSARFKMEFSNLVDLFCSLN